MRIGKPLWAIYPLLLITFDLWCQSSSTPKNQTPDIVGRKAVVVTGTPFSIGPNSATIISEVTHGGNTTVSRRGLCYAINRLPTVANMTLPGGSGTGSFKLMLTALSAGYTYHVRAYATNAAGTVYGNEVIFTTIDDCDSVRDIDGNFYEAIQIGGQCWMKESLRTTHYQNGDAIQTGLDNNAWRTTTSGAFAVYNNNAINDSIYGKLYNWYATYDTRKICPAGRHVPGKAEWRRLIDHLGGFLLCLDKLKPTQLWINNSRNTNTSGFSALPGGARLQEGNYSGMGAFSPYWTTDVDCQERWYTIEQCRSGLNFTLSNIAGFNGALKQNGYACRCIRDEPTIRIK